jgi:hypothetical protein
MGAAKGEDFINITPERRPGQQAPPCLAPFNPSMGAFRARAVAIRAERG